MIIYGYSKIIIWTAYKNYWNWLKVQLEIPGHTIYFLHSSKSPDFSINWRGFRPGWLDGKLLTDLWHGYGIWFGTQDWLYTYFGYYKMPDPLLLLLPAEGNGRGDCIFWILGMDAALILVIFGGW